MNKFNYSYPVKVYFGEGCAKEALAAELPNYGKNVLLAYGGGSIKQNGIYEEITALLQEAGKNVVEFTGIMSNPTYKKVQEGAALVRAKKIDFILAVGGGAVITHEEKKWKGGVFATTADFAVLDPAYTLTVPKMQVLSGAFDTLSHAMETYFGASDQNNVSDDLALAVMKNTVTNMRLLLKDINDIKARGNLMWDSAMAENGILKCGRLTDFQAHQMEHQLGVFTDCNHGQGLAVIQPVYYRHILKAAPEKFAAFAKVVFDADCAEAGLAALEAFIKECGLPTRLSELKSVTGITPELLRQVADSTNIIKSNPRELTKDEIYDIFMECI